MRQHWDVAAIVPSPGYDIDGVRSAYGMYLETSGLTLAALSAIQHHPTECVVVSVDANSASYMRGKGICASGDAAQELLRACDDQLADGVGGIHPNGMILVRCEYDAVAAIKEADPRQNTVYVVHPSKC